MVTPIFAALIVDDVVAWSNFAWASELARSASWAVGIKCRVHDHAWQSSTPAWQDPLHGFPRLEGVEPVACIPAWRPGLARIGSLCMSPSQAVVGSIRRYPVKSMMGEELNSVAVTKRGVAGDRAYSLIDVETNKLVNAKHPQKWPEMFAYRARYTKPPASPEDVPPVYITLPNGDVIDSTSGDAEQTLSAALRKTVRLVRPDESDKGFEGFVPTVEGVSDHDFVFDKISPPGTFFDIGLIHILTTSTIDALRKTVPGSRIESRRFRPNLVIRTDGEEGFVENAWVGRTVRIGQVVLKIKQPTQRCVMTTLAQGDLPRDMAVLKAIYQNNGGNIGVYAEPVQIGTVRVNDAVELI